MFSSGKQGSSSGGAARLSFFGSEVVISGDVATEAQLHVDGRIDGNVRCIGLTQGADGRISGNIIAEEARLAGTVEGTVSAATVIIEATARIMGDVAYDTVSIEAGACLEGRLARRSALGYGEEAPRIVAPVSFSPQREAIAAE